MFKKNILKLSIIFIFFAIETFAKEIPVIVISPGKTPQSLSTVGSSVDVITNEEIEENSKNNTNLSNKEVDKESIPIEQTIEEKLKETEEKLLRSLAEIENQRRRFEKEIKDAFEFGSFNFAKESLAILDNLQRAKEAIKNDEKLKNNKDLDKFLENINII